MKKRIIAIFAVVALLLTLLAIPVFADEDATGDGEEITEEVGATGDGETTENEGDGETTGETTGAGDTTTTGADDTTTTGAGDTEVTVDGGDNIVDDPFDLDDETTETTDKTEASTGLTDAQKKVLIWNLVIGGIVIVAVAAVVVVFFFLPKNREKTLKFFRGLKSEWKKIAWFSWKNTWKGTLVVAIAAVSIAIVIGLLDWGFSSGLNSLAKFF